MHATIDQVAARLAARQHGVFHRRQVLATDGVTVQMVKVRARSGAWIALGNGVYALPGNPPTWERRVKEVELLTTVGGIAGPTAAVLHGIRGFRAGTPELLLPAGTRCRSTRARVRRTRLPIPTVDVDGIRTTTIALTFLEVAHRITEQRPGEVLDDAAIHRGLELEALADLLPRRARSHAAGVRLLLPLLGRRLDREVPPESVLEGVLLDALLRNEVPGFEAQVAPPWFPAGKERVDFAIPAIKVIIEADGRSFHTAIKAFDDDRRRDNAAALEQWRVFRYSWYQLHHEVDRVDAELARLATEVREAT